MRKNQKCSTDRMRLVGGLVSAMLSAQVLSAQSMGSKGGVVLLSSCRGMHRLFTATILSGAAVMGEFRRCECVRRGPKVGADESIYEGGVAELFLVCQPSR